MVSRPRARLVDAPAQVKKPVWFEREAQLELLEAARWYDARVPGLGDDLVFNIDDAVTRVEEFPGSGSPLHSADEDIRIVLVPEFPYMLVYQERAHDIRVLAVAHVRRRPGYWRSRS